MPSIDNKTVHVLHIASGDNWAGAEVMLYILAKTLHTMPQAQVTIAILNHGTLEQKLRDCGIPVFVIDESQLNSLQILKQLSKIVADLKPDIIHTYRTKENILGSIAAWHNGHIPSIRTLHGAREHQLSLRQLPKRLIQYLDWLSGRIYQRYIVAVSPALAIQLQDDFPKSKIALVENGIDVDELTLKIPAIHTKKDTNNYRIGMIGRLVPVKRVDLFIQCAIHIKQQYPELNIKFHIYGDGPLLNQLRAQVETAQAENHIHFEGHCSDIPQQLKTLDALIMTSDHEGLPMILLEAMCMKTAIIAHAVGGIPNLLDHGKCGILVNNHNSIAFAEAIIRLIEHPEQHQQLTRQALERVRQEYSANQSAINYLKIYNKLVC